MKKHQFKPFDQVLVRDDSDNIWTAAHYSHYNAQRNVHYCTRAYWKQCIPYNENTAHLIGTDEPYKEPEPKVWKVTCHKNNEVFHFTDDELKYFIENAVITGKDIRWFTITYDENNN